MPLPRQLRIEYHGAIYHVMNRGDRRERIFRDDLDHKRFLTTLAEVCTKTDWQVHVICGVLNPIDNQRVRKTWRGLLRTKGEAQSHKAPLLIGDLRKMMTALSDTLTDNRDRAIILLGFAGAMRRSELAALDVQDLELTKEGFVVSIRRSKTDQTREGRKIGIPFGQHEETCPVRSLQKWLEQAKIFEGPFFRKVNRFGRVEEKRLVPYSVALIVKSAFKLIGRNPQRFGGHSLRAGLATSAAMAGVEERSIQDQTGHKSLKVLRAKNVQMAQICMVMSQDCIAPSQNSVFFFVLTQKAGLSTNTRRSAHA